jgi:hypothetical protein
MIWVLVILLVLAWCNIWGLSNQIESLKKEMDNLKWDLINEREIKPPQRK